MGIQCRHGNSKRRVRLDQDLRALLDRSPRPNPATRRARGAGAHAGSEPPAATTPPGRPAERKRIMTTDQIGEQTIHTMQFRKEIEPWPGGRWYRDLGNNAGHLWGHVQVIKPPTLLELCGPMPMSYPATNHLQYRLTSEGGQTRLHFTHKAMGLIPPEH